MNKPCFKCGKMLDPQHITDYQRCEYCGQDLRPEGEVSFLRQSCADKDRVIEKMREYIGPEFQEDGYCESCGGFEFHTDKCERAAALATGAGEKS